MLIRIRNGPLVDDLEVAEPRSMEQQLVIAPLQVETEISSERRRDGGYRQMARTTLPFPSDESRRSSSGAAGRAKYSAGRLMLEGSKEHIGMCLKPGARTSKRASTVGTWP